MSDTTDEQTVTEEHSQINAEVLQNISVTLSIEVGRAHPIDRGRIAHGPDTAITGFSCARKRVPRGSGECHSAH